jgi:hypothetical protein
MPLEICFDNGQFIATHIRQPAPPAPPPPSREEAYEELIRARIAPGDFRRAVFLLPFTLLEQWRDLPDTQRGLYVVYTCDGVILYVGKVGRAEASLRSRWQQHHKLDILRQDAAASGQMTRIAWMASEAPDAFLEALEKLWIAALHPVYNDRGNPHKGFLRSWRADRLARLHPEGPLPPLAPQDEERAH